MIGLQQTLLERSALLRRAKYHWGPMLKSMIIADPGDRMTESLLYTQWGSQGTRRLQPTRRLPIHIYLIVPVHDIIRGTHGQTLAALNGVAPKPAIATAHLFLDAPANYYFAYDGHLNPVGSRRIAEYVITLDSRTIN